MYFARTVLVLLFAGAIGLVGYQIGLSQAVATAAPAAGAVPMAYPYWYGPGFFGFGFLGFLFPLFFLFLFFGLLRAAFGGHRGWRGGYGGRGRWGNPGPGGWWGGRWGNSGPGDWSRGGWADGRERIEALHRELHGDKPADKTGGPSGTAT